MSADERPIRVVLADDHDLVRTGLRAVLSASEGFDVVGEAEDGLQAVAAVEVHHPDVVVMDLQMPRLGGIDATARILRGRPGTAVLVLTMYDDDDAVFAAVRAGARGYLLKGVGRDDLRAAVRSAAAGQAVFGPGVAALVLERLADRPGPARALPHLTPREREVLGCMVEGLGTNAIARRLDLADKTIRNATSSILTKLHVTDRLEAVRVAREAGIRPREGVVRTRALLFTDIEGSTRLAQALGDAFPRALAEHDRLVDTAITDHGGHVFGSAGDSRFAAFDDPLDAARAALAAERSVRLHRFPGDAEVRIRAGVHSGLVHHDGGELVGLALNETARVAAVALGGQVLATAEAFGDDGLPADVEVVDHGTHELRDLDRPLALLLLRAPA